MQAREKLFPRKIKKAPEKGLFQPTKRNRLPYYFTDYVIDQRFQSAVFEKQGEML
jgi:hypothetical protein